MICKEASYENFRNIEKQTVHFDSSVNIIYGNNAQGKTNALEGIFLCAQGRSARSSKERDFITFGKEFASVGIKYSDRYREDCSLHLKYMANGRKHCAKNGVPLSKMSSFIGNFRAIIFTPEHLAIVKSGPSERRHFLDCALSQLYPSYLCSLQAYSKILFQRNRLISEARENSDAFTQTVELWSENLAAECEKISLAREEYLKKLSAEAAAIFSDMTSGREVLEISYAGARSKEEYFRLLTENLDKELKYKTTLYGIHKDDLDITLNGKSARIYGSQGQQRSLALSMKLAEGDICRDEYGVPPIFLLDDVFSELDETRRDYLVHKILGKQVIITSCEVGLLGELDDVRRITVENGKYV